MGPVSSIRTPFWWVLFTLSKSRFEASRKEGRVKRAKFSEEQVVYALRQEEAGTAVEDVCRQLGVSRATFYVWSISE